MGFLAGNKFPGIPTRFFVFSVVKQFPFSVEAKKIYFRKKGSSEGHREKKTIWIQEKEKTKDPPPKKEKKQQEI